MATYTNPLSFIGEHYGSDSEDEITPEPVITKPVTPEPVITKPVTPEPVITKPNNLVVKRHATPSFPEDYIALENPVVESAPTMNPKYKGVDLRDILNKERAGKQELSTEDCARQALLNKLRNGNTNVDNDDERSVISRSQPKQKKFRPYVLPRQDAFIFVHNQNVKDSTTIYKNRYDAEKLRNAIVTGLDSYATVNGLLVCGYMPGQVKKRWTDLHFSILGDDKWQPRDTDYEFTKAIADILSSKEPQTLVLCFTHNVSGNRSMLDLIKDAYATRWKIIIWTWKQRLDYHIKKFCIMHDTIQLNYLDHVYDIFYEERK